jgi:hypothetical protein
MNYWAEERYEGIQSILREQKFNIKGKNVNCGGQIGQQKAG